MPESQDDLVFLSGPSALIRHVRSFVVQQSRGARLTNELISSGAEELNDEAI